MIVVVMELLVVGVVAVTKILVLLYQIPAKWLVCHLHAVRLWFVHDWTRLANKSLCSFCWNCTFCGQFVVPDILSLTFVIPVSLLDLFYHILTLDYKFSSYTIFIFNEAACQIF